MHLLLFLFRALNLIPENTIPTDFGFSFSLQGPSPDAVFFKTVLNALIALAGFLAMRILLNRNGAGTPNHYKYFIGSFISLMPFILIGGMIYWGDSASKEAIPQTFLILSLSLPAFLLIPLIGERFSKKAQPSWCWLESGLMLVPTALFWAVILFYSGLSSSAPPNLDY